MGFAGGVAQEPLVLGVTKKNAAGCLHDLSLNETVEFVYIATLSSLLNGGVLHSMPHENA